MSALRSRLSRHGIDSTDRDLLDLYGQFELLARERAPFVNYRTVLRDVAASIYRHFSFDQNSIDQNSGPNNKLEAENVLADSLVDWPAFPDTLEALKSLKSRFKLVVISNVDDDMFRLSQLCLGVPFDWVITSEQTGSYKPAEENFRNARLIMGLTRLSTFTWPRAYITTLRRPALWAGKWSGLTGGGPLLPHWWTANQTSKYPTWRLWPTWLPPAPRSKRINPMDSAPEWPPSGESPDKHMKIVFYHKLTLFAGTLTLLLLLASSGGSAFGQGSGYSEKEAQSIGRMLMCPVCAGTTIEQSQAVIAQQMQGVVREMLAEGASRQEILDFFVARYGLSVLAAPPKSGVNLLVWVLPIAGVLAALAGGYLVIKSMASRNGGQVVAATPSPADLVDTGLEPFLEAVDRDLALSGDGGATGASNLDRDGVETHRERETNREEDLGRNG